MRWPATACALLALLAASALPARAAEQPQAEAPSTPATRSGREIYDRFREGLADPDCGKDSSSPRWRKHFAAAPQRMTQHDDDVLALFGYVVDALRAASLPTEYALIPFVESGYKPGARSRGGPAGMWQMIKVTARNHHVPIRNGYDGRLSPVDSTAAAVRYLKTLHGMFAGDWRLAVMAYNAGEYRVFGALRRSGQVARSADPEKLSSLSGITRAYVRKLHALSCLLDRADDREQWLHSLDRPVPLLEAVVLPPDARSIDGWARAHGRDPATVRRLNPAFAGGRIARADRAQRMLVPALPTAADAATDVAVGAAVAPLQVTGDGDGITIAPVGAAAADADAGQSPQPRTHVVARGESAWSIAHRHGLGTPQLLARNGLTARSVLRPGMVLVLDEGAPAATDALGQATPAAGK
ncbi:transglycosylase SLT domain-containing protein [Luteimonas sp. 50]|uniref:Transglycosylase SLT domain-containing protein n=1 Tax=Cognatiluteimonas sedimenti TaxID=2927791 RepID=A0ABT0A540_9GAMM|nr:lytic transglycosylase domain-containing protein [Lysobacter sedimenti]MCJ0826108.1 transglycosylase SLT domain-containing protein [Lysobacter sedimenti]